ncbi:MAG: NGG1p interacting factor NIF3 [Candidatus Pacebacteria bacterium]|nr:NGG1p interacting factor NIF3 [Candidatus Paceibacterota bacterium]
MKVQDIFNLAIQMGILTDLRGKEKVLKNLEKKKQAYDKLDEKSKQEFDQEALVNPYLDSRILNVADDKEIKKVMVGIDMEGPEILLAKQAGIDLVIAHHPEGKGLANLADVMHLQAEVLSQYGVPINVAEGLMKIRISEVDRSVNSANHDRAVDMARILGVNFICAHTPCDNLAARFLKNRIDAASNLDTVSDLLTLLKEIPEYQSAIKIGAGPKVFAGSPENRLGKVAVTEITGGTEGSPKLYEKMATAGIGTIVGMHQSEEHRKEAEAANINVVIAGHISSDSLGVNLFLDELERRGIEIVPCSGLIRVSRVQ